MGHGGFSMVEALVVVAILGVGLVTIFGMMLFGTTESVKLSHKAAAINIATSTMELIRNYPFSAIRSDTEIPSVVSTLGGAKFTTTIEVDDVVQFELKKLKVVIEWEEGKKHQDIILSTFITNQSVLKQQ